MKKFIATVFLMLFLGAAGNALAATYTYTLDIEILQACLDADLADQIGSIDFEVDGQDYLVTLGDAVPTTGSWTTEDYDGYYIIFDDYTSGDSDYTPLLSGRILTITSDSELSFYELEFGTFDGDLVDSSYYSTTGFQQVNSIPIPSAVFLLGSGIAGILGFARKKRK